MQNVLSFNREAIEQKLETAANYLGVDGGYEGFYNLVGTLNETFNIPKNLTELGVVNPDLDTLTKSAIADPSTGGNPIEMTYDNTLDLLKSCL